ncbi:MAG: hypothetical protein A2Z04_02520 [Chloroflexi bacterium RBG_16_57_9]|nr:MAG: hypothetical protein A2Z04_02520 [Chloroflexi bacterium RBG_16_57_9]
MVQTAPEITSEIALKDPWLALLTFRHMVTPIRKVDAIVARGHDWGLEVWTLVHHSNVDVRQVLADRQWELMRMYPDLDVNFHILDRLDTPLESFLLPTEYDFFIRVRPV